MPPVTRRARLPVVAAVRPMSPLGRAPMGQGPTALAPIGIPLTALEAITPPVGRPESAFVVVRNMTNRVRDRQLGVGNGPGITPGPFVLLRSRSDDPGPPASGTVVVLRLRAVQDRRIPRR